MRSEREEFAGPQLTRQQVLKAGAGAAAAVGLSPLIAACGGDNKASTGGSPATRGGTPKRGGVLRLGYTQTASTEKLDPALSAFASDELITVHVFERLTTQLVSFEPKPVLAERWESNKDASVWTFFLRKNVTFSDGSPFTTKDVKHTFVRVLDEKLGSGGYARLSQSLAPNGIKVVDDHTIEFHLKQPDALFSFVVGARQYGILKDGTPQKITVENAIGTGPFKIKSWKPGQSFDLVRNEKYWEKGLPYLDGVRATFYSEATALVQAAAGGTVQLTDIVASTAVRTVKGNDAVEVFELKGAQSYDIAMDATQAPFDKPQVRKAFKLVVDRDQILKTAWNGYGTTTGDVPALPTEPFYPKGLGVPEQDIEQAKALLAEAGHPDGLDVELFASDAVYNSVAMATAYAEQAKPAGIRVKVKQWPAGTYYDKVWLQKPFYIDVWNRRHPIDAMSTFCTSKAPWNETKTAPDGFDALVTKALGIPDQAQREKVTSEALALLAKDSGYIIPLFGSALFLHSKAVRDLRPSFDHEWELRATWIES